MRLIDLRPSHPQPLPLVVMAMGDSQVCYHYRAVRELDMDDPDEGLDIIIADEQVAGGQLPTGVTLEGLLAICEDRAKHQDVGNPILRLVALQLQAARRALATDESDKAIHLVATGSDSARPSKAHANAMGRGQGESLGA